VSPNKVNLWKYSIITKLFGLTFGIKLMEMGEKKAEMSYGKLLKSIPIAKNVLNDEFRHEKQLIGIIGEERLKYAGALVLGLNDALVELTGTLAGLSFALQKTRIIATAGLITGIAASLSMATSEYFSEKSEENAKNPLKASVYTGIAYMLTVMLLVFPFLLFQNFYYSLSLTVLGAIMVVFIFTYYISVVRDLPFRKKFLEMTTISLGVAFLSFLIGLLVRIFLGINI
jgi:VIT1/CCC1 family predicted Fe2+/Mn2+ transporter